MCAAKQSLPENGVKVHRLRVVIDPDGSPNEVEGVGNPAAVCGPDGSLYFLPRLAVCGNYSRLGVTRVG